MLVWGFFVSTVVLFHVTVTINSLAHRFGTRRFATRDDSRNNLWLALLTFGEGWHNNHHFFPGSVRQGFRWWEVDLTYYLLRLMAVAGLVHGLKPVPARVLHRRAAESCASRSSARGSPDLPAPGCCRASTRSRCLRPRTIWAATPTPTRSKLDGVHHAVDTGFIVFNAHALSAADASVRGAGRALAAHDHELLGAQRGERARIQRDEPRRAVLPAPQSASRRASGACCATCCASTARRRRCLS